MSRKIADFPNNNQQILVSNVHPSPKAGAVVAYADVRIGSVLVYGFSVVRNKNGPGYFVGLPVKFGKTGKPFDLIEIGEPTRSEACRAVLEAVAAAGYIESGG